VGNETASQQEVPAVVPPVAEVHPVTEEAPEQIFSWQPEDEHGRPMGGRQVIKYRTQEEKDAKLIKANNEILRQLRKVTRENRLGIKTEENIPADAQRLDSFVELKPKELNAEERFNLVQKLNNPETFSEGRDQLLESAIGVSPAKLAEMFNDQQIRNMQILAKQNFDIFTRDAGDFYVCAENAQTLTDWMFKNKLAPTVQNFQIANATLRAAGLLLDAPVMRQEPVPTVVVPVEEVKAQPQVEPPSRIAPVEQPQQKRHSQVPSGLNERVSSAAGQPPADGNSLTLAGIEKMSADQYKQAMKNPQFVKMVEKLQSEADARRLQRQTQA
jgi:hypothetical protein